MPLTIFFSSPGTYTIADDGVRGNNTSVVLDSNGTVLFPFVHPADTISFIAEVPGVHFVFNTLDSFGTANVTVGNLTDPAQTPDSISVRHLRSDAFVTLVANGSITEGGADTPADVIAAGLVLSAGTGVGSGGNAIETQVTFLEGETATGGINLANWGNVQVGGLTAEVAGLNVATSGNLRFTTTGFILLADSSGGSSVHGGDLSGNVVLTAIGHEADVFSNINQPMISAAGGGVTITAGRDVIAGTSGTNFNNDILATGPITIEAGRDFILDGTSDVRTGAFGGVAGGAIAILTGRNIELTNVTGGLQTIQAFAGDVLLAAGPGGAFIENAAFPGAIQTTGDIVLTADTVQINSGGLNTTGVGSVTVRPVTAGRAIDLGSPLDGPAALALSDDEFDLLFTLNVSIGGANAGPVQFSAPITPFIVSSLNVRSATEILVDASIAFDGTLNLRAGDDLFFTPSGNFTSATGGFTGLVDQAQNDGGAGGVGSLAGTIVTPTAAQLFGNGEADTLTGSAGNDSISGLAGDDSLFGNAGGDALAGEDGDDTVAGGSDADTMDGGAGIDTLDYSASAAGVSVSLAAGSASGGDAQGDSLTGFENILGSALGDVLTGDGNANVLSGGDASDTLTGGGGQDSLFGRAGTDWLYGGAGFDSLAGGTGGDKLFGGLGKDTMTGNAANDQFVFLDGETAATRVGADIITDFTQAHGDLIKLKAMDADTTLAGDQKFKFIGNGAFTGAARELHYVHDGGNTFIEGDTDGDGAADFVIRLNGLINLTVADFWL